MKDLKYLIIHCTATIEGKEVSSDQIRQWHLAPSFNKETGIYHYKGSDYECKEDLPDEEIGGISIKKITGRGWLKVGYSDMIHLDGTIENLNEYDEDQWVEANEITNGASGFNSVSRHIVYVGGLDRNKQPIDTRTEEQTESLIRRISQTIRIHPNIQVLGHNQVSNKSCPCFDVPWWLHTLGVNDKNIYY